MSDPVHDLAPELYAELLAQARRFAARVPGSMQPSSVVSEVWLKLSASDTRFQSRAHFGAVAAKAMRQVLADRSRRRNAQKRSGDMDQVSLDNLGTPNRTVTALAIEQALQRLDRDRPRGARIVELRLLGGLTVDEVAEHMGLSTGTIKREWRVARAFLIDELG